MAEAALAALYRAVGDALSDDVTVAGLAAGIFADQAPAKAARPYVLFFWAGGGETYLTKAHSTAELMLVVKAVADQPADAFALAAAIDGVLNNADYGTAKALDGGADWAIVHEIGGLLVHLVENTDGIQHYHEGKRYTFLMEAL